MLLLLPSDRIICNKALKSFATNPKAGAGPEMCYLVSDNLKFFRLPNSQIPHMLMKIIKTGIFLVGLLKD